MSKLFKEALEKVSTETKEKVKEYLDFMELCMVQKSFINEGYILTIHCEFVDSDSLVYCFEVRYENKVSKKLYNRITTYCSMNKEQYWNTYQETLKKGIEYILKLKENETKKRN